MHVRQVKLKVTKQQRYNLNKMFYIAYKIYVICVKKAQKELRLLKRNQRYKYLIHLYVIIKQEISKLEEDKSKLTSKKKSDKEQIKLTSTHNFSRGWMSKQAVQSMLAQANSANQGVLSLLQ